MKNWTQHYEHNERTTNGAEINVCNVTIGLHSIANTQCESEWLTFGETRINPSDVETLAAALLIAADCLRTNQPLPNCAEIAKVANVLKEIDK